MATNKQEYEEHFIKQFRTAFSNKKLTIDVLTCEGTYCGAHGYLHAKHIGEFLGEKASNLKVKLRFGVHWRVDVQKKVIPEGWAIFDLPAFFIQIGVNLFNRMNEPIYLMEN